MSGVSDLGGSVATLPEVPPSPRPRRLAPPSWLDLRLLLGVLLVLASVLIGARVVAGARHTYPRVAVRHDLAAGTVLAAGDLELVRVQLPGSHRARYLARVSDAVGKRLGRPVTGGELLPAAALAAVPAGTTVTVPLAAGSAPALRKGERLELWVSAPGCASVVLLPDVPIQSVRTDSGGSFGAGSGEQDVVVSVAPELAQRVVTALAIEDVHLRAGVLSGPAPTGTAALPDLAACTAGGR
jgi:hypothetical protein